MATPLSNQQLDEIEACVTGPLGTVTVFEHAAVAPLVAEVRRLRALEEAAVYARSALAALCYDLEDPGSNALGALYLLQQATLYVDAPKDDTSDALLQHARKVLHGVADIADPEPPEVSFFGPTFGPQVAAWLRMLADRRPPKPAPATSHAPVPPAHGPEATTGPRDAHKPAHGPTAAVAGGNEATA